MTIEEQEVDQEGEAGSDMSDRAEAGCRVGGDTSRYVGWNGQVHGTKKVMSGQLIAFANA